MDPPTVPLTWDRSRWLYERQPSRTAGESIMAQVTTLGVDIAKNGVCLHGVDAQGPVLVQKRLARQKVLPFIARLPPCLIGGEASGGAHYWARELVVSHISRKRSCRDSCPCLWRELSSQGVEQFGRSAAF